MTRFHVPNIQESMIFSVHKDGNIFLFRSIDAGKTWEEAATINDESPYADRITIHLGPALETIASLEGEFDLVFIDADKGNYASYYEAVLPRLSARGLIAIDNTLWSGRVLDPQDADSKAIAALNDLIAADERVVAVQLTIRDGVTLIRRS